MNETQVLRIIQLLERIDVRLERMETVLVPPMITTLSDLPLNLKPGEVYYQRKP